MKVFDCARIMIARGGKSTAQTAGKNQGAQPVTVQMNIPWDQILQAILSLLKFAWDSFSQLIQQIGNHWGIWGQLGLSLLVVLLGLWMLYQLLRIIMLIMLRVVLPLAVVGLTLLFLVILTT